MEKRELISLWRECEEETREQRKIKYPLSETENGFFKLNFADFINWLEERDAINKHNQNQHGKKTIN